MENQTADTGLQNASGTPEIPAEEERLLARVLASLAVARAPRTSSKEQSALRDRVDEMVALRDEIGEARLEDVPALVAQMERLQGVALTRADLQTHPGGPGRRRTSVTCACASRSGARDRRARRAASAARPSSTPRAASTSSTGGTRP